MGCDRQDESDKEKKNSRKIIFFLFIQYFCVISLQYKTWTHKEEGQLFLGKRPKKEEEKETKEKHKAKGSYFSIKGQRKKEKKKNIKQRAVVSRKKATERREKNKNKTKRYGWNCKIYYGLKRENTAVLSRV